MLAAINCDIFPVLCYTFFPASVDMSVEPELVTSSAGLEPLLITAPADALIIATIPSVGIEEFEVVDSGSKSHSKKHRRHHKKHHKSKKHRESEAPGSEGSDAEVAVSEEDIEQSESEEESQRAVKKSKRTGAMRFIDAEAEAGNDEEVYYRCSC